MTRDELIKSCETDMKWMLDNMRKKNADYSGASSDAFSNFKRVEALGIATTEQGFLTRMTDKLCRAITLTTSKAQVSSETIQDTLLDLANYALLMAAYMKSKQTADVKGDWWGKGALFEPSLQLDNHKHSSV